jgi:hypothetical protein
MDNPKISAKPDLAMFLYLGGSKSVVHKSLA